MRSIRLSPPRDDVSPRPEDQEPVRCRSREARGPRRSRAGRRCREDALHRRAGDVQGGRSGLSCSRRRRGWSEAGLGPRGPRDGRRSARRRGSRRIYGPKHLPGEGSDRHDPGDRPNDLRRRLARRGLSRVRPMDRLVWVGAFPHEDNEDVRSIVSAAMEVGVHGILLVPSSPNEIRAVRGLLESVREDVSLVRAAVTSIRPIGLGDRVCVDTCSLLRDGEGMLVGNSSAGLFLVHAETAETGYVAARPFRVNAGAVHAYIYLPGGKTKYLSELRAGDEVLAVDSEGRARAVVVGRVKVERRPLLLLEAEADGLRHATIVQNRETIRFVTPAGGSLAVSQVKAGDEVLVRLEEGGRHFGMRIRETIAER